MAEPFVIGLFGDSRSKGSNAHIGSVDMAPAIEQTYVLDPTDLLWRKASILGREPYPKRLHNNPGRVFTAAFRTALNRPVYLVQYGVPGSRFLEWLSPKAQHGLGQGLYWPEFNRRAGAAFRTPAMKKARKTKFDLMIVSMGANNGSETVANFQLYTKSLAAQIRQWDMLKGTWDDLPIIWYQMQQLQSPAAQHNATLNGLMKEIPNYATISTVGVSNVGDNVHEDSPGLEKFKYNAVASYRNIVNK